MLTHLQWDIEMSKALQSSTRSDPSSNTTNTPPPYFKLNPREVPLPAEIIAQILLFLSPSGDAPARQSTLHALTLLSRTWYTATIASLYSYPQLHGGNFSLFSTTICPSKNYKIRFSPLATLVRCLDMSSLVHNSSKSLTARLLGRLKGNLETFIAPQASFAINSFAALSKCVHLRTLDLRLISASISNRQLFQTLRPLTSLETLYFPRSSSLADKLKYPGEEMVYVWPPQLTALHLAGGVDDYFLRNILVNAPGSLETLSIQHCSQVFSSALLETLQTIGSRLQNLTIRHPMPKLQVGALDHILLLCERLVSLRISADYISNELFESIAMGHPLRVLHLDCSPQAGADVDVDANALCAAVDDGRLADLRSVGVSARLAWDATVNTRRQIGDLVEALEDGEMERPLGVKAGVFVIKD